MADHLETGRRGEALAEAYLRSHGYKIVGRNIANPSGIRLGEIDIVAKEGKEWVFVEVKTLLLPRPEQAAALPEWQVTRSKLHKLERIAEYYLRQQQAWNDSYRFDVVAVTLFEISGAEPDIRHLEHVHL